MELNNHGSSSGGGGGGGSSSATTSTILSSSGHDYEVFLSFRGPDTRTGFTDHLYHSLRDAGVNVFRDDEELRIGEEISTNLIEAINNSKISLPIFSEDYASSKWCLDELARIVERRKSGNHEVMPIFWKISPSDVRNQAGSFGDSFSKHDCRFSQETVGNWKKALKEVGSLKGWEIDGRQYEAEVVKKVVDKVLRQLKKDCLLVNDLVVGVGNRVWEMMSMLNKDLNKVKIVAIHGMGGIGKTTLAKIIYNQLLSQHQYEGCSFLANVRETSQNKGIMYLQNQLISDILKKKHREVNNNIEDGTVTIKQVLSQKKVVLFLDDVSQEDQCKTLIGDGSWFGEGSRIIITTPSKEILNAVNVDWANYEVTGLDFNHSLHLFSMHAFRRDSPPVGYEIYSEKAVKLCGGLPLALEVIGSLLHGKPKSSWEGRLRKLENAPHEKVEKSLKISFDELDIRQKQIFLDVACLFVEFDKRIVLHYWEDRKLCPEEGMEVLEDRSLLKIKEDNSIWMHDQLVELGRDIVRKEGNMEPENQSRVWDHEESWKILNQIKEAKKVKAMFTEFHQLIGCGFTSDVFKSVPNLTFLKVDGVDLPESLRKRLTIIRQNGKKPIKLPELRWLSWHSFNHPPVMLKMEWSAANLVILDLSRNPLTHHWEGWNQLKGAKKLRVLNLSDCDRLTKTPSFTEFAALELLILRNCCNLVKIDKSIVQLKSLIFLDLSGCLSLSKLPDQLGNLEALTEIRIDKTEIMHFPDSIGNLKSLKIWSDNRGKMKNLPAAFWKAVNLEEIYVQHIFCAERKIPGDIGRLSHLRALKLTGFTTVNKVPKLPESLIYLHLHFCYNQDQVRPFLMELNEVPDLSNLVNLRELDLRLYHHKESRCLWSIRRLPKLETLTLSTCTLSCLAVDDDDLSTLFVLKKLRLTDCYQLETLSKLPSSLLHLHIVRCSSLQTFDVSYLKQLLELEVSRSAITEIHGLPSSLEQLCLKQCSSLQSLILENSAGQPIIFSHLRRLAISSCPMLHCPTRLPSSLQWLVIKDCGSITTVNTSNMERLKYSCVNDNEHFDSLLTTGPTEQELLDLLSQLNISYLLGGFSPFNELVQEILASDGEDPFASISWMSRAYVRLENRMWQLFHN